MLEADVELPLASSGADCGTDWTIAPTTLSADNYEVPLSFVA